MRYFEPFCAPTGTVFARVPLGSAGRAKVRQNAIGVSQMGSKGVKMAQDGLKKKTQKKNRAFGAVKMGAPRN